MLILDCWFAARPLVSTKLDLVSCNNRPLARCEPPAVNLVNSKAPSCGSVYLNLANPSIGYFILCEAEVALSKGCRTDIHHLRDDIAWGLRLQIGLPIDILCAVPREKQQSCPTVGSDVTRVGSKTEPVDVVAGLVTISTCALRSRNRSHDLPSERWPVCVADCAHHIRPLVSVN